MIICLDLCLDSDDFLMRHSKVFFSTITNKICWSTFPNYINHLFNFRSNMALLCSNTGKLMRLCAQVYGNSTKSCVTEARGQFTQQEETYFNKVIIYFLLYHINCGNLIY